MALQDFCEVVIIKSSPSIAKVTKTQAEPNTGPMRADQQEQTGLFWRGALQRQALKTEC